VLIPEKNAQKKAAGKNLRPGQYLSLSTVIYLRTKYFCHHQIFALRVIIFSCLFDSNIIKIFNIPKL